MVITFRDILRRAGARISNVVTSTSSANDIYPKLKDWVNERYERIYDNFPWRASLEDTTLQIVASQRAYALSRDIDKIWAVYDQTNGKPVGESELKTHFRFRAIDLDQTGNVQTSDPGVYYPVGDFTVKAEIGSTAEKIDVVSTSTADVTPNVVHITGLVSEVELSEDIVLTGTTGVSSSNTYDATQKLRISVGTNDESRKTVVGAITVDGNTSGTVFAKISPKEVAPIYKWVEVSPLPTTNATQPVWLFWYSKRLQMLVDDNDIPIIDVGLALIEGCVAQALKEDGQDEQANIAEAGFGGLVEEKKLADTGPNLIEQFVGQDSQRTNTLDYGRRTYNQW